MSESLTRNEMIAFHECGHATMAIFYGVPVIKIDLEVNSDKLPGAEIDANEFNKLPSNKKIDFYISGYAAEKIYVSLMNSSTEEHFAKQYAHTIFKNESTKNSTNDMTEAKKVMWFPFFKEYQIKKSRMRAYAILENNKSLMFYLFKELLNNNGCLKSEDINNILASLNTQVI